MVKSLYDNILKDISKLRKGDWLCINCYLSKYRIKESKKLEYATAIIKKLGDSIFTMDNKLEVAPYDLNFIKIKHLKTVKNNRQNV